MDRAALEKLLASGTDTAMLRLSLAQAYRKEGRNENALSHVRRALELDPNYSAAWKLYGTVLNETGDEANARMAWEQGISVAEKHGDVQAAREMRVFVKRIARQ